jgi:mono/diheme cytochrome c family protein
MACAVGIGGAVLAGTQPVGTGLQAQQAVSSEAASARALVDKYCVTCHNERLRTAGLALDRLSLENVAGDAEAWEKAIMKLRGGMMPPQGMPRPPQAAIDALASFLETTLDASAAPLAARASLHRLNRTEYGNAVRDLLDLDIDVSELLPSDDESSGFDNMADVLRVSPTLLEQYLSASRKVASLAIGDPKTLPISHVFRIPPDRSQQFHIDGLPLGTRGGILIRHNFPLDARYDFSVVLLRNIVGYMTGLEFAHELEIAIDGERVFAATVGGDADNLASDENMSAAADAIDARLKARVPVMAGPHEVVVAFVQRNQSESDEPLELFTRDLDLQNMNGLPVIDYVNITGPVEATGPGDTPSRRRVFLCNPSSQASAEQETACARRILSTLARRAYRVHEVADADVAPLLDMYRAGRGRGTFDAGIEQALRLILTSPKFLFRYEPAPAKVAAGTLYRISDLELASRLSFFLWSSIPDDELVRAAGEGRLADASVLEQQVRRMLADSRAGAIVENFAGQWLFLRNLQSFRPDPNQFPNFDDNLRQAFRRETEMLFEAVMREDRSVLELLTADYTFVNERLARHYGMPRVHGSHFRRVKVTDENRRGLLGHGSILAVTSYPNRTSPVLRGKWIMESILGTPPPAPPPNVPALADDRQSVKTQSVRERLEAHRRNPTCATCHRVMDPLGFTLENFDAVGAWRTREPSGPVDAAGQLADGTAVDGPVTLREAILRRPEQFAGTMTEKLLTYALGRGLGHRDMPVVRAIVREAAGDDYRFSRIVLGIVKSTPFQMREAPTPVLQ